MIEISSLIEEIKNLNTKKEYGKIFEKLDNQTLSDVNNAELYALKSQALYRSGLFEQSEIDASKALSIDRQCVLALHYKGNCLAERGSYESALNFFNKVIRLNPNHVITYNSLGNTYLRLGNNIAATEAFLAGLKLDPNNEYLHNGIGNMYFSKGQLQKAEKSYKKAIECNPKYDAPHNGLGNLARKRNDLEDALLNYEKAYHLARNKLAPIFNLAMTLFDNGDFKKSLKYFNIYVSSENKKSKTNTLIAYRKIQEIEEILSNIDLREVSQIIREIKATLRYTHNEITHYTSFTTTKELLLENSKFRITEGTFLNDPAEGSWLFHFISKGSFDLSVHIENTAKQFIEKPFIGSFVSNAKHDDLTLWRMYGKENKDEATGCAITLMVSEFIQKIKASLGTMHNEEENNLSSNDLSLYRVAYFAQNNKLIVPGFNEAENNKLSKLLENLKKQIVLINQKNSNIQNKESKEISGLLNSIAFLFKSLHYQYENEIRLVLTNPIGFDRIVDKSGPAPRVFINLTELSDVTTKITFGPRVPQRDNWASVFYHTFSIRQLFPEIFISTIPFK